MAIARSISAGLRQREARNLLGVGVYGSVGRGDERAYSDVDMLVVVRKKRKDIPPRISGGVLIAFLVQTRDEANDEVTGSRPDLNVALAGWRSLRILYDPRGVLARLRDRARRPRPAQFREAARRALLETFEDLGKLRNSVDARDRWEAREMAIWFTGGAMGCLFDLEAHVLETGRRAFIEAQRYGRLGRSIVRLRFENLSISETGHLAESIWSALLRRARLSGIEVPDLLRRRHDDVSRPIPSRLTVAKRVANEILRREGRNLLAIGVYGSVGRRRDRRYSDLDLFLLLRERSGYPRITVREDVLVSFLQTTVTEVRAELQDAPWNLPEAVSGWRSMRCLYDSTGLLRRLQRRVRTPGRTTFNRAASKALLAATEDLGKLRNAVQANDWDEAREMAVWFSEYAMMGFLSLKRHVVQTGRRIFVEGQASQLGRDICQLRYRSLSLNGMERLAESIWKRLGERAHRLGLPIPEDLHGSL